MSDVVLIEWTDAAMYGTETVKFGEPLHVVFGVSVGMLIEETDEYVALAMHMFPGDHYWHSVAVYPKSGIKSILRWKWQENSDER